MGAVRLNFNSKTSFCGNRTSCSHFQPPCGRNFETSVNKLMAKWQGFNARLGDWGQWAGLKVGPKCSAKVLENFNFQTLKPKGKCLVKRTCMISNMAY